MSQNNMSEDREFTELAIEGKLPLKAVGIENLREANPGHLPPHRYLHPWFARRPTPASRLAILASILPKETDPDDLLRWMKIGPDYKIDTSISKHVEKKKATEDQRDGDLTEHYGYPRPFTSSPTEREISELHESIRGTWDGELPKIIDPTAGGGVIPFESLRYQLPTIANELNPVPVLILKTLLEYAPSCSDIEKDVHRYAEKVNKDAKKSLEEYFPSESPRQNPENQICTYKITCQTCGSEIPLVKDWNIRTASKNKVISKPVLNDGELSYECATDPDEGFLNGFDPKDGPLNRGGAVECLDCGVVTESDEVQRLLCEGKFEYDIYCMRVKEEDGGTFYRAPTAKDQAALKKAEDKVQSDFELSSLLATKIPEGQKTNEILRYGPQEWRDLYSPRQLITHQAYLQAFNEYKGEIVEKYSQEEAECILTLLTFGLTKCSERNSRLTVWDSNWGYPSHIFDGNNYAFKYVFVDNNMPIGASGYMKQMEWITDSYKELRNYLPEDSAKGEVTQGDAAELPYDSESLGAAIVDPPYYTSIMYAELSDVFYVWMKECLEDIFPDLFESELTDKENEAVANPSKFSGVSSADTSKRELANREYETKMGEVFSEIYRLLRPGGVMTVMFTHKETDAWNTLTMSLIRSGFTVTSTHPITSEMPLRASMQGNASADSTLLLTGRKPHKERDPENTIPTLWTDVKADTRKAAKEAARELLNSGLSLTKTDVIISAFGPTLRVFADAYPVVDDEDNEVKPRRALEEAREAVTQVLVDEFLEVEGVGELDDVTEWYVLCWLVHEAETFSYDEGRQLGLGIGVDIDEIKRSTKTWRKSRGDISLRGHDDRVQNINEKPKNRSSRTPVNPDDLSFGLALDKVHAAMHIYDVKGESACCDWLRERNFGSDSTFKATLQALLQVLPHDHEDWELARDLAVGRTRDVLDLDFSPNVFAEDNQQTQQTGIDDY